MENIFVEFLPPWVETGLQPAFYDKESGTVLQQTARMYDRVNMLVRMFNKLSKNTKEEIETFEHDVNETVDDYIERFNTLYNYVHDYFDNLDVQEEINNKLDDMVESGEFEEILSHLLYHHFVPVESYGAVGDGTTDDTQAIKDAIDDAYENSVILFTKTYKITDTITASKNLTFTGGGTIKPLISSSKQAFLVNNNCQFKDITIDGSLNTQDQFDQQTYTDLILLTGIKSYAEKVIIDNVEIKNFYGNAIQFFNHKQVSITNTTIDNVGGHWYQNNTYDAFGDGIYFGGTTGDTYITINNTIINGKYKSTTLSRCGLCFENLGVTIDGNQYVELQNFKLNNYDRLIHIENINGKVYINGDNVVMHGNCLYNHGDGNVAKGNLVLNNSSLSYTGNAYNGSYGICRYTFIIRDSVIDASTRESIANYNATGTYDTCKFTVGNAIQCNSAGKVLFKNCTLDMADSTIYIIYNSDVTYDHCTFNGNSDTVQNTNNSFQKVISCTFNKYIVRATYLDLYSIINMSADYVIAGGVKVQHRLTTFKLNNVIQWFPNIAGTIPMEEVARNARIVRRDVPADGTISILPTISTSDFVFRKNSKYALVSVGTNDWVHEATARNFNGVYLNIITTDSSGNATVGATSQIGTVSSGYAFTIDDVNHTFARSGTYSNICISYLLDMNDLNYIANYSA